MSTRSRFPDDFEIHVDQDCQSPATETSINPLPSMEDTAHPESDHTSSADHAEDPMADSEPVHAAEPQGDVDPATESDTMQSNDTELGDNITDEPTSSALSTDSLDDWIQDGYAGDSAAHADLHDAANTEQTTPQEPSDEHTIDSEFGAPHPSDVDSTTDTDIHDDAAETVHADDEDAFMASRPASSASRNTQPSPTAQSSLGDSAEGSHNGADDDVFSNRSLRSSVHSSNEHYDDDTMEQTTEKGQTSPLAKSRVASGVSASDASVMSGTSRLSRYDKEEFVPTSRNNRPAFRSPSAVRALQMSSPTPSVITSPVRSAKRQPGFPTISRLGSPSMSSQSSPSRRGTPSRFKRHEEPPPVLLHVTLLPLRWGYSDMMNHFEAKKLAPLVFSSKGIKNLRNAWRQLRDRLGDAVLERGILLPHPQDDLEILEERMLEAIELPVPRRARILECGHYLGPSNKMTGGEDIDDESEYNSDVDKEGTRHGCKTCKGEIKYEELGTQRVFRIKVYASNGLMSAGAWNTCWREMERVDIEVEPIIDASIQSDLAKLSAAFDHEHQQRLEAEQRQQEEEEQRFQLEAEQRLSIEEERQQLEAERQQFEEERRQSLEEAQKQLEQELRRLEEDQRQRLDEERRQQFEEDRQILELQRQQFEEQRLELEEQRKLVEEEQRQHLEDARRQELELEQKLIEEQRQELEAARQQFEEERRQQLEDEEEIRRLQREEDEQKQAAASRSTSRNSYVEEELPSPATERPTSPERPRRRDSARLREIYGTPGRTSSDEPVHTPSPSVHTHVDSARQREEEQNSRQLAISAPQDSSMLLDTPQESRIPNPFSPSPSPPSAPLFSQQTYQRQEVPRRSLDSASLAELLGESIRVLLQDPKNIAIAVMVVFIAILTGQFATRQERGIELYQPQQPQYKHHQLDSREPVGQVIMNTPPKVETVYHTVTAQPVPEKVPVSKEVEIIYQTVTQYPTQETATRVVETIYSTVTAQAAAVEAPGQPQVASELTPSSAEPSIDLPLVLSEATNIAIASFVALGLDPFVCPASAIPEPESDKPIFKTGKTDEHGTALRGIDTSLPSETSTTEQDLTTRPSSHDAKMTGASTTSSHATSTMSSTSTHTKTMVESETITEIVVQTAKPKRLPKTAGSNSEASSDTCAKPVLFTTFRG